MLSRYTVYIIIHRRERWLQKLWLMFLTANEKNCQQQKQILFYLNDRPFCCSEEKGLKFHSGLHNDYFFLLYSSEGTSLLIHHFLPCRYGQKKWLNKSECRHINRTHCDLSAETSDYEHQYYAKVKATRGSDCSKWAETGRFYPFLESK